MIDLYHAPTPNVWKVSIMLEECRLPYRTISLSLKEGEQRQPQFLEINPNGRVPAIVDHDVAGEAQPVFESGAILIYLAEKTGQFLAPAGRSRVEALEWLMWQMGGLGPMAGQAHHFSTVAPEGNDYGRERYVNEATRLYGVMDTRLQGAGWLAGGAYGIADMACWPWVWFHRMHGQNLADFPAVKTWFETISARSPVQAALAGGLDHLEEEARARMSGPYWGAGQT